MYFFIIIFFCINLASQFLFNFLYSVSLLYPISSAHSVTLSYIFLFPSLNIIITLYLLFGRFFVVFSPKCIIECNLFSLLVDHSRLVTWLNPFSPFIWFTIGLLFGFGINAIATNLLTLRCFLFPSFVFNPTLKYPFLSNFPNIYFSFPPYKLVILPLSYI